jgi:hypothetical protein
MSVRDGHPGLTDEAGRDQRAEEREGRRVGEDVPPVR